MIINTRRTEGGTTITHHDGFEPITEDGITIQHHDRCWELSTIIEGKGGLLIRRSNLYSYISYEEDEALEHFRELIRGETGGVRS